MRAQITQILRYDDQYNFSPDLRLNQSCEPLFIPGLVYNKIQFVENNLKAMNSCFFLYNMSYETLKALSS